MVNHYNQSPQAPSSLPPFNPLPQHPITQPQACNASTTYSPPNPKPPLPPQYKAKRSSPLPLVIHPSPHKLKGKQTSCIDPPDGQGCFCSYKTIPLIRSPGRSISFSKTRPARSWKKCPGDVPRAVSGVEKERWVVLKRVLGNFFGGGSVKWRGCFEKWGKVYLRDSGIG